MGVTYFARSGGCFDVSVAGADCLGFIHAQLGLPVDPTRPASFLPWVRGAVTGPEARKMGAALHRVEDAAVAALQPELVKRGWWAGEPVDLVIWVRRWEEFLIACNGYDSDPEGGWNTYEPDYSCDPEDR